MWIWTISNGHLLLFVARRDYDSEGGIREAAERRWSEEGTRRLRAMQRIRAEAPSSCRQRLRHVWLT